MARKQVDPGNALIVERNNYSETLNQIIASGFCPFCKEHLFKHHTQPLIFESHHWFVTRNAWPYEGTRFHFLFIARAHIEKAEDLSPTMWSDFLKLYQKLITRHQIKGATLLMRSGNTAVTGATVSHLHAQLIVGRPRTKLTEPIKALVGFKKK